MDVQPWLRERIEKYRRFYAEPRPGQIMVIMALWAMGLDYSKYGFQGRPMNSFDHLNNPEEYAEHNVRRLRVEIELLKELGDDTVPNISAGAGMGLNSIYWTDADMTVSPETSWVEHVLTDWDKLDTFKCDPSNKWFQVILRQNRRYQQLCEGDYAPMTQAHFSPLDLALALRGNDLFMDFYDAPEQVHRLLTRSAEAITMLQREQLKIIPQVMGGTPIWGTWVPGPAIFMSEDIADLCSPDIYKEFGRPYSNTLSHTFGGCWIHHHARGLHVHKEVAKVEGLKQMEISMDPNCPKPIDQLADLYQWNGDIPVLTRGHTEDLYKNIDLMKQHRTIFMLHARDLKEAKEAIAFIRKNSTI